MELTTDWCIICVIYDSSEFKPSALVRVVKEKLKCSCGIEKYEKRVKKARWLTAEGFRKVEKI